MSDLDCSTQGIKLESDIEQIIITIKKYSKGSTRYACLVAYHALLNVFADFVNENQNDQVAMDHFNDLVLKLKEELDDEIEKAAKFRSS